MLCYQYRAVDALGKVRRGQQQARDLHELEQRLQQRQLSLISAKPSRFRPLRLTRRELITFFSNLEQLSRAGVPLLDSLHDLRHGDQRLQIVLGELLEHIEGGKSLSQALALQGFHVVTVNLVLAGETSGNLTESFSQITESLKWQDEMAAHTKNVLLYPAIMGVVIVAMSLFLLLYLVPQMLSFVLAMGKSIPWHTQVLLWISNGLLQYWYIWLSLPILLGGAMAYALPRYPQVRFYWDKTSLSIWLIGPLLRKIILARFAYTFAMMYRSGVNVLSCIEHATVLVNNRVLAQGLSDVCREIAAGKSLGTSFTQTALFPPLVLRMLKVGETTGALDSALLNISYFYQREVQDSVKRIQTLIEPSLTIALGVLLGWVMLAVLSPIYDVIGQVKF